MPAGETAVHEGPVRLGWISNRFGSLSARSRHAGTTTWKYWKLWNFAIEGITSFSSAPLRLASYFGFAVSLFAFLYAVIIIFNKLVYGNPVAGYPSLIVAILFLGGVQLVALGIIGEYVGRLYEESKQRPVYLARQVWDARTGGPADNETL